MTSGFELVFAVLCLYGEENDKTLLATVNSSSLMSGPVLQWGLLTLNLVLGLIFRFNWLQVLSRPLLFWALWRREWDKENDKTILATMNSLSVGTSFAMGLVDINVSVGFDI